MRRAGPGQAKQPHDSWPHPSTDLPPHPSMDLPPHPSMDLPRHPSMDLPPHPSMDLPRHPSMDLPPHPSMDLPPHPSTWAGVLSRRSGRVCAFVAEEAGERDMGARHGQNPVAKGPALSSTRRPSGQNAGSSTARGPGETNNLGIRATRTQLLHGCSLM
uniref:Uncharacterized protein n=1 Tax=Knipowitschia caucasica TaxID=637954 RepID=A0AAV2JZ68_KNICA